VTAPADGYVAEFTRDIPRAKVLSAGVVARPEPHGAVTVKADARIAEVAALVFEHDDALGVVDADGNVLGALTRDAVLDVLLDRDVTR
jgi:glycine betaine/proline transport system ATP-binding protein